MAPKENSKTELVVSSIYGTSVTYRHRARKKYCMAPKENSKTELVVSSNLTTGGAAKNTIKINVVLTETVIREAQCCIHSLRMIRISTVKLRYKL